ncbi:hypothetical protein R3W88_026763 [Solanum pinnatisectum]|uniref:Reverse transcriptase zinc-binding domain-containing protein n=1 Tax=Solanum pinnatisectum TaxID=50273 RepID=A0AAV9LEA2_9SOLN|nr:hypothetical protein R3W88_026763 [Solanum pinnatisectum]
MYLKLMPTHQKVSWKSIALQQNIHPRHKFILWLAIWRRLATIERLQKFGIHVPPNCAFCGTTFESFEHFYFECRVTRALWHRLLVWLGTNRTIGSWQNIGKGTIISCVFAMLVYLLWRERNVIRFQSNLYQSDRLCKEIALHIHMRGRDLSKWKNTLQTLDRLP